MEWPERPNFAGRVRHWLGRQSLSFSGARCLDSWGQIARALGQPRSILCVGNGPSSEDSALADLACDCLFRVNWVWQTRALLTRPQIIFTADPDVPPAPPEALIAFPTRTDANRILGFYRGAGILSRIGYVVLPELPSPLSAKPWPLRPTNGALMIAAAAQLQPERLAIAGIDLYQHPAGKYPGETVEANDYDAIHSRDNDLDAIALALADFHGELVVVGNQLRDALTARASPA